MKKILVTGATGQLGKHIVLELLKRMDASQIVGLTRDPEKADDLAEKGIEIRQGDYLDRDSLAHAFVDIDKLMFISTSMFSDVLTAHRNVVEVAKSAGIRHVHYTAMQHPAGSSFSISQVSEMDQVTMQALNTSGMAVTYLYNTMYLDALPFMLGEDVLSKGVFVPVRGGRAALAARPELAEAAAVVLSGAGHEGRSYTLGGSEVVSLADIADILTPSAGKALPYVSQSKKDFIATRVASGLPEPVVAFIIEWFEAIEAGEFEEISDDLERLIGRKPLTAAQFLPTLFSA